MAQVNQYKLLSLSLFFQGNQRFKMVLQEDILRVGPQEMATYQSPKLNAGYILTVEA